jgi:hypothetical protein
MGSNRPHIARTRQRLAWPVGRMAGASRAEGKDIAAPGTKETQPQSPCHGKRMGRQGKDQQSLPRPAGEPLATASGGRRGPGYKVTATGTPVPLEEFAFEKRVGGQLPARSRGARPRVGGGAPRPLKLEDITSKTDARQDDQEPKPKQRPNR